MTRVGPNVQSRLLQASGHTHLNGSVRGRNLTVYSEEDGQREPRLRFTALPGGQYGLSFRHHTGKWEPAPFSGSLEQVIDEVEAHFGWHLEPWP